MSEKIKEILEQLKDSVDYPRIDMPTFDGTDSEFIDNDTFLEPDKCKLLLDYITNLQQKVEQLDNIRKEAIEYVYKHIQEYDTDGTFTNLDEFDFIASPQMLLNILNKGSNKE